MTSVNERIKQLRSDNNLTQYEISGNSKIECRRKDLVKTFLDAFIIKKKVQQLAL